MNIFERFLYFLEGKMQIPTSFGWFHLMFVGLVILFTIFLCIKFRDCDDKIFRRIALITWIVILVLEVLKQLVFAFEYDGNVVTWSYAWYVFPYQLCDTPLYVLPFIAFLKENKIRDTLISYSSFFAIFGGLVVFIYPNDVFTTTTLINFQTMIHHGSQIALGIFFATRHRRSFKLEFFLKGIPVFAILVSIAIILNESMYGYVSTNAPGDVFNAFYISRHFPCTLPILSEIYKAVPYIVFCLIYILGFTIVAFIIYCIEKLIISLVGRKASVNAEQNNA